MQLETVSNEFGSNLRCFPDLSVLPETGTEQELDWYLDQLYDAHEEGENVADLIKACEAKRVALKLERLS